MTVDEAIKYVGEMVEIGETYEVSTGVEEYRQLAEWLKELKQLREQEPCDDCISRQAVLGYICNDLGLGDEENGADLERKMELQSSYDYIKSLPPAQPEIVRCKDCVYYSGENYYCELDICVSGDDFCSKGVRKSEQKKGKAESEDKV